jgi:2'-5' RNA ligase
MAEPVALRLFVAIELPEQIKWALGCTIDELSAVLTGPFRWVSPAGIHVTLKFLGDTATERLDGVVSAMTAAAVAIEPFTLRLSGAGTFPAGRRPSVVWAGLGGDTELLAALRNAAESAMVRLGFEADRRAFQAHLTLARVPRRLPDEEERALAPRLQGIRFSYEDPFDVREVSLMQSELRREGARYTKLASAPLGGRR